MRVSGFQIDLAASRSAYQRVGLTAFDITEPGQTNCYYLQPDGVNDGYVTGSNLDLSGTDKVTVFAAVRKLSDAADGIVVELTNGTVNGRFGLQAPGSSTVARFQYNSRGTASAVPFTSNASFNAPFTGVITGQSVISTDTATLRINGTQVGTDSADQGTGNFASSLLYLFRRGGTTLPFNGQCFATIVAGGSYSTATIQRVEQILSKYTPGVTL
jgi:hypothetical protein